MPYAVAIWQIGALSIAQQVQKIRITRHVPRLFHHSRLTLHSQPEIKHLVGHVGQRLAGLCRHTLACQGIGYTPFAILYIRCKLCDRRHNSGGDCDRLLRGQYRRRPVRHVDPGIDQGGYLTYPSRQRFVRDICHKIYQDGTGEFMPVPAMQPHMAVAVIYKGVFIHSVCMRRLKHHIKLTVGAHVGFPVIRRHAYVIPETVV